MKRLLLVFLYFLSCTSAKNNEVVIPNNVINDNKINYKITEIESEEKNKNLINNHKINETSNEKLKINNLTMDDKKRIIDDYKLDDILKKYGLTIETKELQEQIFYLFDIINRKITMISSELNTCLANKEQNIKDVSDIKCLYVWLKNNNLKSFLNTTSDNNNIKNILKTYTKTKNIFLFQNTPYEIINKNIKYKEISDLLINFNEYKNKFNCNINNLGFHLFYAAEQFLPDISAYNVMTEIYDLNTTCDIKKISLERFFQRAGLLFLQLNQIDKAKSAFTNSLTFVDLKEEYRSLFWLGVLENKNKEIIENNNWWKRLITKYPLVLHSILVKHLLKEDPMHVFNNNYNINFEILNKQNLYSSLILVYEYLLVKNNKEHLLMWSDFIANKFSSDNSDELFYLAWCHYRANNFNQTIITLSKYLKYSVNINKQFLTMYFPNVFISEILEHNNDIDPMLIISLIRQESAFNTLAHSAANARGLMQLLPSTAKQFSNITIEELHIPVTNIKIGSFFLENLMKKYNGKVEYVLSAYNAGPTPVNQWIKRYDIPQLLLFIDSIPYKETRNYVSIILRNYYWYSRLLTINNDELTKKIMTKSEQSKWKSHIIYSLLKDIDGKPQYLEQFYVIK